MTIEDNFEKFFIRKNFCQYCFQCFSRSTVLECHIKQCLAINHTQLVLLSKYLKINKNTIYDI